MRTAAGVAVLCVLDLVVFADLAAPGLEIGGPGVPGVAVVAVAVLGFLPLVLRLRHPRLVFVCVLVFTVLVGAVWFPLYRPTLALLVALYTVAAYEPRTAWTVPAGTAGAGALALMVAEEARTAASGQQVVATGVLYLLMLSGAWGLGLFAGRARRLVRQAEERREAAAREAVAAERRRVARELHDIVSHSVSVMMLQAAGARRIAAADNARALQALATIEDVGVQAMSELRRLLSVLRVEEPGEAERGDPGRPGLRELDELLRQFLAAGLDVDVSSQGEPAQLDDSVDLAAYRVVQEALTNVAKHAGPAARAHVHLQWGPDAVELTVENTGAPGAASDARLSTGHGLLGLRERVSAVEGRLDAVRLPDGGFRVCAVLPTSRSSRRQFRADDDPAAPLVVSARAGPA